MGDPTKLSPTGWVTRLNYEKQDSGWVTQANKKTRRKYGGKKQPKNQIKLAKLTKQLEKRTSGYHKDRAFGHTPERQVSILTHVADNVMFQ